MLTKFWSNLTSEEIKKLGNKIVLIFPFSSIEQHGDHLPVSTDKLILDGILKAFAQNKSKTNNYIIMPNTFLGSASEHSNYKGTISINSSKYIDYVTEIISQFCDDNYQKFIFLNSHGGQISHLDIAAKELKSKYSSIDIIKANYFLFEGFDKFVSLKEIKYGYHGGEFETSLMLHLFPDLVKTNKLKKNNLSPDHNSKKIISFEGSIKRAWNTQDISKSGIIGDPSNSSAEKGRKILEHTVQILDKILKEIK